uniref:Uncharacterized protein n=1 Tax=Pelusios castaneus TaxID=367368 RepID=A0A8C8VKW8_9SAUR
MAESLAMTSTVQTLRFQLLPHDTGPEWPHSCEQEIERQYQVVPSVVCTMCCLFGIIYCFFGECGRPGPSHGLRRAVGRRALEGEGEE